MPSAWTATAFDRSTWLTDSVKLRICSNARDKAHDEGLAREPFPGREPVVGGRTTAGQLAQRAGQLSHGCQPVETGNTNREQPPREAAQILSLIIVYPSLVPPSARVAIVFLTFSHGLTPVAKLCLPLRGLVRGLIRLRSRGTAPDRGSLRLRSGQAGDEGALPSIRAVRCSAGLSIEKNEPCRLVIVVVIVIVIVIGRPGTRSRLRRRLR